MLDDSASPGDMGFNNLNFLDEDIEGDEERSGSDDEYKRGLFCFSFFLCVSVLICVLCLG